MAETIRILLRTRSSVSLHALAHSHGWSRLAPFDWNGDAGLLHRTEHLRSDSVIELCFKQADKDAIEVHITSETALSDPDGDEVQARARWMLCLDADLDEFYELCRSDPHLAHVPAEQSGRILRSPTVFEDAVKCICTTNTTWSQTMGMVRRLVEVLGKPGPISAQRAFPTPQAVATVDDDMLQRQVRLGYRTSYVHELARRITAGEVDLEAMQRSSQPTSEHYAQLLRIKGIGPYAAASLLALLGRYDYIGVDTWARKLVSKEFYDGEPVSDKQVQSAFDSFGRWRALAYWFYRWDD